MSGFRITQDSSRRIGQRVVSVHLTLDQKVRNHDGPSNQEPGVLMEPLLSVKEVPGCTRLLHDNTRPRGTMAITP